MARDYRADIDGLRALAVIAVILFHFGMPPFTGGFIGVDIFFVISGYLITSILHREMSLGRFSILGFYERRIRRIGPALAFVLAFTLAAGSFLLVPADFRNLGQAVVAAIFSGSNLLFWYQSDYFADSAQLNPLLHTWSLGVEEQFYIVFPLILFCLRGRSTRLMQGVLLLLAIASLALSVWSVAHKPTAAFFLSPMRAWELLIGSLLALDCLPPIRSRIGREATAILGLGLIGYGLFAFSAATPFPGLHALLPCLGSALLIHAGGNGGSTTSRALSFRPIVFIGLISYSLYLWHWPLLAFARYLNVVELSVLTKLGLIVATFMAATFTWYFVERPFRGRRAILGRRAIFGGAAATMAVLSSLGVMLHVTHGWPGRLPGEVLAIAEFKHSRNPKLDHCLAEERDLATSRQNCRLGAETAPHTVLLGDSHADAIAPGIALAATGAGASLVEHALFLCPPVLDVEIANRPGASCRTFNEATIKDIEGAADIETVILAARWSLYVHGLSGGRSAIEDTVIATTSAADATAREQAFEAGLERLLDRLRAAGKIVAVVYPTPEMKVEVPASLAQLRLHDRAAELIVTPVDEYRARNAYVTQVFDRLQQEGRIMAIRPQTVLCDNQACQAAQGWTPLYADTDHLSQPGTKKVAPLFEPVFIRPVGPALPVAAQ